MTLKGPKLAKLAVLASLGQFPLETGVWTPPKRPFSGRFGRPNWPVWAVLALFDEKWHFSWNSPFSSIFALSGRFPGVQTGVWTSGRGLELAKLAIPGLAAI